MNPIQLMKERVNDAESYAFMHTALADSLVLWNATCGI